MLDDDRRCIAARITRCSPDFPSRIGVERDETTVGSRARMKDDQVIKDNRRGGEGPLRQSRSLLVQKLLRPKLLACLAVNTAGASQRAQRIDATAVDRRRRA